MSKITKYYCDSCGAECGGSDYFLRFDLNRIGCTKPTQATIMVHHDGPRMVGSDHLCTKCVQWVLDNYIDNRGGEGDETKEGEKG